MSESNEEELIPTLNNKAIVKHTPQNALNNTKTTKATKSDKKPIKYKVLEESDLIPPPAPAQKSTKSTKKPKLYNVLKDEYLIPSTTSASVPDGKNVLKNILSYPETNIILNISKNHDLKVTLEKLDSSASLSVANLIDSLIKDNSGQLPIYAISL